MGSNWMTPIDAQSDGYDDLIIIQRSPSQYDEDKGSAYVFSLFSNGKAVTPKGIFTIPENFRGELVNGNIELRWDGIAEADKDIFEEYRILKYHEMEKVGEFHVEEWNETSFLDTEIVNSGNYTYFISAINLVGESPKSDEILIWVPFVDDDTNRPDDDDEEPSDDDNATVEKDDSKFSGAVILIVVIIAAVMLVAVGIAVFLFMRRKVGTDKIKEENGSMQKGNDHPDEVTPSGEQTI
jgi:hypothetical protein